MSRRCSVCESVDRPAIDELLIAGRSIRDVARRFGVSKSTLHRHCSHIVGLVPKQGGQGLAMISQDHLEALMKKAEAYEGLEYLVKRIKEEYKTNPVDRSFAFFVTGHKIHLAVFLDGSDRLRAKLNKIVRRSIDEEKDINELFEECLEI